MSEVGNEHPGSEIVKTPAFRRPVIDAGAADQDGLGGCVGSQGARFKAGNQITHGIGRCLAGVMQGFCHQVASH